MLFFVTKTGISSYGQVTEDVLAFLVAATRSNVVACLAYDLPANENFRCVWASRQTNRASIKVEYSRGTSIQVNRA